MEKKQDYPIDIVIPWVDCADIAWQESYHRYRPDIVLERYRDWGLLRYWFRGIAQFAPWVNKIYFVTNGQLPEWLNLDAPKLIHVRHEDFIPEKYLPTFNSRTIEFFYDHIPGLSEHFILFNDDFFITAPVQPERFFRNGLPCDMPIEGAYRSLPNNYSDVLYHNISYINKFFDKKKVLKANLTKWFNFRYRMWNFQNLYFLGFPYFISFRTIHQAQPYLKSMISEVHLACGPELEREQTTRFRSEKGTNHYLVRAWQLCTGRFSPANVLSGSFYCEVSDDNAEECASLIRSQKYSMICLNDAVPIVDFDGTIKKLQDSFHQLLPNPCVFEK